jgi:hypothetical protein
MVSSPELAKYWPRKMPEVRTRPPPIPVYPATTLPPSPHNSPPQSPQLTSPAADHKWAEIKPQENKTKHAHRRATLRPADYCAHI